MHEVLGRLQAALASAGDPMLDCFRPPASPAELDAFERTTAWRLPAEVRAWFEWHDGLEPNRSADYNLVPFGLPLGLAEAAEMAATERRIREEVAREFGLAEPLWDPGWLPLFHDRSDLLVVRCAPEHRDSSPVWFRMSEEPEVEVAYDSLRGLVGYAAECWELGAFERGEHGMVEEDRTLFPDIWCRWNPLAAEKHGGVPPFGVSAYADGAPGEQEEPDPSLLLEKLKESDELRRLEAVAGLARAGHGAALEPGIGFLRHPSAPFRWSAAQCLAELGDAAAAPALIRALDDEVEQVRMLAADALASFREEVGPEARRALASVAENDPDDHVRRAAADALARIEGGPA